MLLIELPHPDFSGYHNGPEQISSYRNKLQWEPEKGGVGYDRNDPYKVMYVFVGRYVDRYVSR